MMGFLEVVDHSNPVCKKVAKAFIISLEISMNSRFFSIRCLHIQRVNCVRITNQLMLVKVIVEDLCFSRKVTYRIKLESSVMAIQDAETQSKKKRLGKFLGVTILLTLMPKLTPKLTSGNYSSKVKTFTQKLPKLQFSLTFKVLNFNFCQFLVF